MWGVLGSIASGLLNNYGARARQDDAQDFSASQYAKRYQVSVADIEKAGLNPALAYGGISGSPPSSTAASSAGFPDLGASYNQSRQTDASTKVSSAQVANLEADTANKQASADLIAAQAASTWATATNTTANTTLIERNVDKVIQETANLKHDNERISWTINLLAEQAQLAAQQGKTQIQVRSQLEATIAKLNAETKLLHLDAAAAESFNNLGREAGQAKPFVEMILSILRGLKR